MSEHAAGTGRTEGRSGPYDPRAAQLLVEFLRRTHLSTPAEVARIAVEEAAAIGWRDLRLHLVDLEQRHLIPLVASAGQALEPLGIDASPEGEAFATSAAVRVPAGAGTTRLVLPLLDGVERLGTLSFVTADTDIAAPASENLAERYSHLIAQTVVTKGLYSDVFELARRSRPMRVSSELVRALLPPRMLATNDVALAGFLEPTYTAGGDSFDFAINAETAHIGIFDAMGHGLPAAGHASFAVAAYRSARRRLLPLGATYLEMDLAIARQGEERFVTGILAELELQSGKLRLLSAGHPAPLLLRNRRFLRDLHATPNVPLGLGLVGSVPHVKEEQLEAGDIVVFYTDGFPEARRQDGEFFTVRRLVSFVEQEASGGHQVPEILRRLRHAVLEHQQGRLQDDATAVILEWRGADPGELFPTAK